MRKRSSKSRDFVVLGSGNVLDEGFPVSDLVVPADVFEGALVAGGQSGREPPRDPLDGLPRLFGDGDDEEDGFECQEDFYNSSDRYGTGGCILKWGRSQKRRIKEEMSRYRRMKERKRRVLREIRGVG